MSGKPRGAFAMGSHLAEISAATVAPTPPQREELERFLQPAPAGTGRRSYTTKLLIRKGWIRPLGNLGATLYQITSFGRAALARGASAKPAAAIAIKAVFAADTIRYTLHQISDGRVWSSPEVFEAPTMSYVRHAVIAGYLLGSARWAEDVDGVILCGMDASGNLPGAVPVANLESVRDWHRRNVSASARVTEPPR